MKALTAADFRKVIRAIRKMTPAEIHLSMIKAGILTKSGGSPGVTSGRFGNNPIYRS